MILQPKIAGSMRPIECAKAASGKGKCNGVWYCRSDKKLGEVKSSYIGSRTGDIKMAGDGTYYLDWYPVGQQLPSGQVDTKSYIMLLDVVTDDNYDSAMPQYDCEMGRQVITIEQMYDFMDYNDGSTKDNGDGTMSFYLGYGLTFGDLADFLQVPCRRYALEKDLTRIFGRKAVLKKQWVDA